MRLRLRLKPGLDRFMRGYATAVHHDPIDHDGRRRGDAASKYLRTVFNLGDFKLYTRIFGNPLNHRNRALALGTAHSKHSDFHTAPQKHRSSLHISLCNVYKSTLTCSWSSARMCCVCAGAQNFSRAASRIRRHHMHQLGISHEIKIVHWLIAGLSPVRQPVGSPGHGAGHQHAGC